MFKKAWQRGIVVGLVVLFAIGAIFFSACGWEDGLKAVAFMVGALSTIVLVTAAGIWTANAVGREDE